MDKVQISAAQLSLLMYIAIMATALLSSPTVSAGIAGLDMWIAPIWGTLGGILLLMILIGLHQLYPGKTLVEYADLIFGKMLGKLLSFLFLFFTLYSTGFVLRQFSDFLGGSFLQRTPQVVIAGCLVFVCATAVRGGMEVICRIPFLFAPLAIVGLALVFIPLAWKITPVQPIMENGLYPSLMGGVTLQVWFSIFSFSTFYLPSVRPSQSLRRWVLLSPILLGSMMLITNWNIASFLGQAASMYYYPFVTISRFTSFNEFFEHLESTVMMVWVVAFAVRIMYGYYGFAVGLAQWLQLPDYKPLVLPIGMLLVLFCFWGDPTSIINTPKDMTMPWYYILSGLGIPSLLLLAAWVKKGIGAMGKGTIAPAQSEDDGTSL